MIKYDQRIYYTKKGSIMATLFSENLTEQQKEHIVRLFKNFQHPTLQKISFLSTH